MTNLQKKSLRNFIIIILSMALFVALFFSSYVRIIVGLLFSGFLIVLTIATLIYCGRLAFIEGLVHWRIKGVLTEEEYKEFDDFETWVIECSRWGIEEKTLDPIIIEKLNTIKIPKGYEIFW